MDALQWVLVALSEPTVPVGERWLMHGCLRSRPAIAQPLMVVLSAFFYFISQHSLLSLPLWILAGFALGAAASALLRNYAWMGLSVVGFVIGIANIFLGSMVNAVFLNAYGTYGTAVITHEEETSSQLNDANIWEYDAVVRTADGQDIKTGFDTMSASLYPPRNAIEIPPKGERFVVKYIPGFERNIAIMRDESPFGKRLLLRAALEPVERAAAQVEASPDNPDFRREYRDAVEKFLARHSKDAPPELIDRYRNELERLGGA
ncbi:hypothetical protein ASE13_14810 [Sphingomonas sp. Root241]|nr:hypothetical protein ASE13_14810 [Sphingomonas sp. Root241]